MGTYPVILYPKLIADFRQRHCYSQSYHQDFDSNPSQSFGTKSQSAAVVTNQSKYLSKKQVFALLLLGTGLVVIGIASFRSSVGLLAFGVGTLALMASLWDKLFTFRQYTMQSSKRQSNSSECRDILPEHLYRNSELKNQKYPNSQLPTSNSEFPTFNSQLRTSNSELQTPNSQLVQSGSDLKVYLSHLSDTMRGKVLQPDGVTDAPIGASEKAFGLVLEKFFQGRVKAQLRLPIPNWDGAYSTDFTISFPEIGIWIDCEIDEPYDYKTGKPTHCTDDKRDRNRNKFFLSHNWIVVRFSESQVVLYPESCCKELVLVIKRVTGMEMFSKGFATVPTLKPAPMWTVKQAKKMAKVKYRDKYLLRGSSE